MGSSGVSITYGLVRGDRIDTMLHPVALERDESTRLTLSSLILIFTSPHTSLNEFAR